MGPLDDPMADDFFIPNPPLVTRVDTCLVPLENNLFVRSFFPLVGGGGTFFFI